MTEKKREDVNKRLRCGSLRVSFIEENYYSHRLVTKWQENEPVNSPPLPLYTVAARLAFCLMIGDK